MKGKLWMRQRTYPLSLHMFGESSKFMGAGDEGLVPCFLGGTGSKAIS